MFFVIVVVEFNFLGSGFVYFFFISCSFNRWDVNIFNFEGSMNRIFGLNDIFLKTLFVFDFLKYSGV